MLGEEAQPNIGKMKWLIIADKFKNGDNKKEVEEKTVSVRRLGSDKQETFKREDLIKNMLIANKLPLN